ncbi:hypothetical protein AM493_08580 [Flavobacterium akiainvivens]|uniref:Secretion system C-terminal sorting domain-containing protein n=1 Tax=Flavobacterium akiainvivens TaxID=1202724 RepID=A0A0M8MHU7_9FLAO|nr:T9SS type A sorting domain-containing protein [Flavobacterium akiainvivens]KOS06087.1 hypothetical protein AM493_08580 [Flavobacterium akiainvivens]SFQ54838.1 Por secretion system C-terminal sorting domain-containing protein [Flavobacterium akiainvivens]
MKNTLHAILLFLFITPVFSQDYSWQWATRGGGTKSSPAESVSGYDFTSEQINDIVVDNDNNYYFLAYMTQQNTEYDGLPIPVYNAPQGNTGGIDIVLISTTCDGTLRWTQTIGGGYNDFSYKLGLDNNGGLYLSAYVMNLSAPGQMYLPPHFSPNVALPEGENNLDPQEGRKTAAVVKYNTQDGALVWYKMLQGAVSPTYMSSIISNIIVDTDGNLRVLVGLYRGTHLDGQVTVPDSFTNTTQFYIVKLSPEGEYLDVTELPMQGVLEMSQFCFNYDENLNRYYIAGFRTYPGYNTLMPTTYGGVDFTKSVFILALEEDGTEIWRVEEVNSAGLNATQLQAFVIDDDSNLYLVGKYFRVFDTVVSLGNYTFPSTLGNVVYVLKMAPDGTVIWGTSPQTETSSNFIYDIAINGDEIAVATEMFQQTWDDITINRGQNYLTDPVILRINKETGNAFAIHDVKGPFGFKDSFTAIATDKDGNYITGGYFRSQLFTDAEDGIETLEKVNNITSFTDFFIAKLAKVPCGTGTTTGLNENSLQQLKVYPNPAHNTIEFESTKEIASYTLTNMLGQTLLKGSLNSNKGSINIQALPVGNYVLALKATTGKVTTQQVIKM